MDTLPNELIQQICDELVDDQSSLKNARFVNRGFADEGLQVLWRCTTISSLLLFPPEELSARTSVIRTLVGKAQEDSEALVPDLMHLEYPKLESLFVENEMFGPKLVQEDDWARILRHYLKPTLTTLFYEDSSPLVLSIAAEQCPQLASLELHYLHDPKSEDFILLLESCPKLNTLVITADAQHCLTPESIVCLFLHPSLEDLNIGFWIDHPRLFRRLLDKVPGAYPRMKSICLIVNDLDDADDETLVEFLTRTTALLHLEINDMDVDDIYALGYFAQCGSTTTLQTLSVSFVNDRVLRGSDLLCLTRFKALRSLILKPNMFHSNATLQLSSFTLQEQHAFFSSFPSLEYMSLSIQGLNRRVGMILRNASPNLQRYQMKARGEIYMSWEG